jgi:hypothetical protein
MMYLNRPIPIHHYFFYQQLDHPLAVFETQAVHITAEQGAEMLDIAGDVFPLRGYPETGVGKTVDLLDSWRTSYQHRSARPWFIEYCRERTILPI